MSDNQPEWSYPVKALELEHAKSFSLEADAGEREALAARIDVPVIHAVQAKITVTPEAGRYVATGKLYAKMDRECVRSGKIFEQGMEADIEGYFADKGEAISFVKARKKRAEEFGDEPNFLDESEDPEPLGEGGTIDLGELAAQHLSLYLDPYPVSPDAPPAHYADDADPVKVENPFAVLGQLRDFMGGDEN